MMTRKECRKAYKEGTWLVHTYSDGHRVLIRVIQPDSRHRKSVLVKGPKVFYTFSAWPQDLRVATPNDMLKYGE